MYGIFRALHPYKLVKELKMVQMKRTPVFITDAIQYIVFMSRIKGVIEMDIINAI